MSCTEDRMRYSQACQTELSEASVCMDSGHVGSPSWTYFEAGSCARCVEIKCEKEYHTTLEVKKGDVLNWLSVGALSSPRKAVVTGLLLGCMFL